MMGEKSTALAPAGASMAISDAFLNDETFERLQRAGKMFASSSLVPEHMRKNPADCMIALAMARQMGESPMVLMQNMHVVKGKAGFSAQYMIARANASGIFEGTIGWRIEGSGKTLSVTAHATLRETGEEVAFTVDMAMAEAEKWTANPKYRTMPEVMLRYRSATFLVRFYAPHVMLGYQTTEEIQDVAVATMTAEPKALSASRNLGDVLGMGAETVDAEVIDDNGEATESETTDGELPL